jgi:NADH-quinone oxidoreductase subunit M
MVLLGAFSKYPVLVLLATGGVILAAAYLLWATQRTLFGRAPDSTPPLADLSGMEAGIMTVFAIAIIGLGLFPAPVIHRMDDAVISLVNRVNLSALMTPTAQGSAEVPQ